MEFLETQIRGCYEIIPRHVTDLRGRLVKTLHEEMFHEKGLVAHFAEEYYSVSKKGVLRGLHFQIPPCAYEKLIYCIDGQILDVLVDLRVGSPTYGESISFDLSSKIGNILYIPEGIAHGFYVVSDMAIIVCKTTTVYASLYDKGILWSSVDVWPTNNPILSEKDKQLPLLKDFINPFIF